MTTTSQTADSQWSEAPLYPLGSRFVESDERFWIARDDDNSAILFIRNESTDRIEGIENIFSGLSLYQDTSFPGCRVVCKLTDRALVEKFEYVCIDVVKGASNYEGAELYKYFVQQLKSWSYFLRPSREGLSEEEYLGFWGELSVIEEYYLPRYQPEEVARAWVGPQGAPQDIASLDFTVEVKSTYSKTPKTLKISSLEQLDSSASAQALVLRRIDKSTEGASLVELTSRIESFLSADQDALIQFQKNISDLYGRASEKQLQVKNIVLDTRCWLITIDFPRIKRSEVHEGVLKAKYEIAIVALGDFRIAGGLGSVLDDV